jgi:hypothetical protein
MVTIIKPGKPAEDVKSYRPFSLLPILSKVFEKLFTTRIHPILQSTELILDHRFGFRRKDATNEQVHRITNIILAESYNNNWTAIIKAVRAQAYNAYQRCLNLSQRVHFMNTHLLAKFWYTPQSSPTQKVYSAPDHHTCLVHLERSHISCARLHTCPSKHQGGWALQNIDVKCPTLLLYRM